MATTPILLTFLLANSTRNPTNETCIPIIIQAATQLHLCTIQNDIEYYIPQVINKTITPESVVSKYCDEFELSKCLQDFADETEQCWDEKHKKGLEIGIAAASKLKDYHCTKDGREQFVDEFVNEPYCRSTLAITLTESVCGIIDTNGFIHDYDTEGCQIMDKTINCTVKFLKLGRTCSDEGIERFKDMLEILKNATPCGKDET